MKSLEYELRYVSVWAILSLSLLFCMYFEKKIYLYVRWCVWNKNKNRPYSRANEMVQVKRNNKYMNVITHSW